jgi:hypothetical protein
VASPALDQGIPGKYSAADFFQIIFVQP